MSKGQAEIVFEFDRNSDVPLHRQLYNYLRARIHDGTLSSGIDLPPSREIAARLSCSRNTILHAFDLLIAEGYVIAKRGSSTKVAHDLPIVPSKSKSNKKSKVKEKAGDLRVSDFARNLNRETIHDGGYLSIFNPGRPDFRHFPFDVWSKLFSRVWRAPSNEILDGKDPAGSIYLRSVLADFLRITRSIECTPEQIIITSGTANSLDILSRILINKGDKAWIEEPGFFRIRSCLERVEADIVPVKVDQTGMMVDEAIQAAPDARLAIVTPSHHFPFGGVMSAERRIKLIEWARENGSWIVEDDYNSEFRYAGPSLSALQSIDDSESVIYLGTFSKVIFPNLRLGYIIGPRALVSLIVRSRLFLDSYSSYQLQPVLAQFIEEGHMAKHIWRMRKIYKARQAAFLNSAKRNLSQYLDIKSNNAGFHVVGFFDKSLETPNLDIKVEKIAAEAGLGVQSLSSCYISGTSKQGLIIGYAGISEEESDDYTKKLARLIQSVI